MTLIKKTDPLEFQWPTQEPFLFCVHHYDFYPKGEAHLGPEKSQLLGRALGQDFQTKDGFRMYHGREVPGFPVHPHRGFETITVVRKGYVDHADSLGAAGRYGQGDVQWMTAGSGIQHSEMFPLLKQDEENTLELFQIWLNLPKKSKMVTPHFKMFWSEDIPKIQEGKAEIQLIAGQWSAQKSLAPPPDSWAAQDESDTQIWLIHLPAGEKLTIPPTDSGATRTLYFFAGDERQVFDQKLSSHKGVVVSEDKACELLATGQEAVEVLVLQSKPIGEPVVQYGPFVMNSEQEIRQTIQDYQSSQFGGWPWPRADATHGSEIRRFAKYPDGHTETPS